MRTYWLIMEGGLPSLNHSRFESKAECMLELARLIECDKAHNRRIDERPATGRGACFLNTKRTRTWTMEERQFPDGP